MAFVDMYSNWNLSGVWNGSDELESWDEFSNFSSHFDEIMQDFKDRLFTTDRPDTIVLIACYIIVFVLALFGNLMVILVILLNKSMRTSITNSYLLNLAVADLLVTLICIPLTVGETVYRAWVYGYLLCKSTNYLQGLCISASVLTIMALSLDRYLAIRHPVRSRQISSATCVRLTIVGIWFVSGIIMVPLAIVRSLTWYSLPNDSDDPIALCAEVWPSKSRTAFDIFIFFFMYIIPGTIVIFSYSSTGCRLMIGDHMLQRTDSDTCHGAKVMAGRRRLARMLLVLAVLFALSWMPYHAVNLYIDCGSKNKTESLQMLSFALLLGHSHSAQNPVLYCFMNRNFKRALRRCLLCQNETLSRVETWRGTRQSRLSKNKGDMNDNGYVKHKNPLIERKPNSLRSPNEYHDRTSFLVTPDVKPTSNIPLRTFVNLKESGQSIEMTPLNHVIINTSIIRNNNE